MKMFKKIAYNLLAIIVCIIMFTPVYLVFINSVKTDAEASSMGIEPPAALQWGNFTKVLEEGKLFESFGNSMIYAIGATALAVVASAMAAYVLSRNRSRFNRFIYYFLILGIAMPTNFVTLTKIMQWTHLNNTQIGIVLLYGAMQIPFNVFLIYAFIGTIPKELDEAAIIDGCSPYRLFFVIILPLLKPVLVTTAVLDVLNIWNEFLIPLYYLNNTKNWPMTLAVYNFFGPYQAYWNLVSADVVLTILPVIIIYLFAQRFILSGMVAGSVKG